MTDWLGMIVPRALLRRRKPPRISLNEPDPDDEERLAELREQGSRLQLPHPVRAFLRFDEESAARQTADMLQREGYRCQLRAEQDGHWMLTAIMQMVPKIGAITYLREEMQKVGGELGGTYMGWDAPIVS
jgi:hypothetical protein